jgi:hypothetical protein
MRVSSGRREPTPALATLRARRDWSWGIRIIIRAEMTGRAVTSH